ncbi:hypothetical protein [Staphylococcus phage vB_SauH_DELF3]|nr:hypothetical protein [Staphylococcus phage vB_SauH_DELF3]
MYTEKYRNLRGTTHSISYSSVERASTAINKEIDLVTKENKNLCVVDGISLFYWDCCLVYTYSHKMGLVQPVRNALGQLFKPLHSTASESNKYSDGQK